MEWTKVREQCENVGENFCGLFSIHLYRSMSSTPQTTDEITEKSITGFAQTVPQVNDKYVRIIQRLGVYWRKLLYIHTTYPKLCLTRALTSTPTIEEKSRWLPRKNTSIKFDYVPTRITVALDLIPSFRIVWEMLVLLCGLVNTK